MVGAMDFGHECSQRILGKKAQLVGITVFLGAALAHTTAFNTTTILWWSEGDPFGAAALWTVNTLMILGLLLILSLNRWLMLWGALLTALVSTPCSYFIRKYQLKGFGVNTIALFFETNPEEASGFITADLLFETAGALAVGILLARLNFGVLKDFRPGLKFIMILGCLIVSGSYYMLSKAPLTLPFNVVSLSVSYFSEKASLRETLEKRKQMPSMGAKAPSDEMIVVLIIGEAARPDHLGINGYLRPTTPSLERLDVISFTDVTSCGTLTRIAVPCLLTRATIQDPQRALEEFSLINAFDQAGFHTGWFSNQRLLGKRDTPVSALAHEAHKVKYNEPDVHNLFSKVVDGELLPYMDEFLAQGHQKAFIVFHTIGSHWHYDNHYPEEFKYFVPTCTRRSPTSCSHVEVVNSYDNSILYTDHFISQVIERLKGKRAIVWYVSDHGESLGEQGRWGHGQAPDIPEQRKVPMIVWASRSFVDEHPEKWARLGSKRGEPLTHDHVFHSLLHCASVDTPLVDPTLSLCGPENGNGSSDKSDK